MATIKDKMMANAQKADDKKPARKRRVAEPKLQEYLPGQEPLKNARVHAAALRYIQLRDERIAAGKEEHDAHQTLLLAMVGEGLDHYDYGELHVAIDSTKKCKCRIEAEKPQPEENGEGE